MSFAVFLGVTRIVWRLKLWACRLFKDMAELSSNDHHHSRPPPPGHGPCGAVPVLQIGGAVGATHSVRVARSGESGVAPFGGRGGGAVRDGPESECYC